MDPTPSAYQQEFARLDQLIREITLELIRRSNRSVSNMVAPFLQRVVEQIDIDRATFIETSEPDVIEAAYGWARPAIATNDINLEAPRLKWLMERLAGTNGVFFFDSRQGPVPAEGLRTVKSTVAIPLSAPGRRKYALALDAVRSPRAWPEPTIDRVRFVGEMLAGALDRGEQDQDTDTPRRRVEPWTKAPIGTFDEIVGTSGPLRAALARLEQVAATDSTVLVQGETGTGKELFARAIHARSLRNRFPLVTVNCAALPASLIESELFGHERGAFTGAATERQGRFEVAHRGSIFLDEIGDLPLELQAKLLRVLQNREFERLGSCKTRKVDVRVIAATHRQLDAAVASGEFRADLFYRLSVFPIRVPPLRDRQDDIPALVWSYIRRRQHAIGRTITEVPASFIQRLQRHSWPGNVRELENVIERALIRSNGDAIDLTEALELGQESTDAETRLQSVERKHIEGVLRECDWRINGSGNAAEQLGLRPNTLRFRIKKLGIVRTRPKPAAATLAYSNPRVARRS